MEEKLNETNVEAARATPDGGFQLIKVRSVFSVTPCPDGEMPPSTIWRRFIAVFRIRIRIRFVSRIRIPNADIRIQLLMKLAPKAKKIHII